MKPESRRFARYVICMGALLSNLSAGMLNVALLDMADEFRYPVGIVQWVITIYLLTIAVCLPIMGRLGDIRSKRAIHNGGFLLFLAGALCCAFAPSLPAMLAARVVQGIGASMYQATNMALVVSLVPSEHRGRALGVVSTFVAAGTIVGPSLGGVIVQWMSWRANFWVLVGMTSIIWLLAQFAIPKDRPTAKAPVDLTGAALFAAGLGAFVTVLNMGSVWGWDSPGIATLAVVAAASAWLFMRWSKSARWNNRDRIPFIQICLFSNPTIRLGFGIAIISYMSAFSTQIVLPLFLRSEMGLEPAVAGLLLVGYPLSLIVSAPISGDLSDKFGSTRIMMLGLGLMAAALTALSFISAHTSTVFVISFIVLLGSAMGMITSPNNNLIMGNVDKDLMSFVGSMIALSRNIGMMLGSVLGSTLINIGTKGGFPVSRWLRLDPVLFGYRSVFIAAAACVAVAGASQFRLARKRMKQRTLSADQGAP